MSTTTMANLSTHGHEINFKGLSKTFQDAITVTKALEIPYLWIDALCIVQDDMEDWGLTIEQMTAVYGQATIMLSASVATSDDSGLFNERKEKISAHIPIKGTSTNKKESSVGIAIQSLSSFDQDVTHGTLSQRAWCTQERILPLRIVHFGRDQLHWECPSTCLSESSSLPNVNSSAAYDLRKALAASNDEWAAVRNEINQNEIPEGGLPKQVFGRGFYGSWYKMIQEYTKQDITKEMERMPAIAGLARAWAQRTGEIYASGLWNDDIAVGLLWSGSSFYSPYGSLSNLRRPVERKAPSWSWLSFDGPIEYPLGKLGPVQIQRPWFVGSTEGDLRTFEAPIGSLIRITGKAKPVPTMRSFSPEMLSHLAANYKSLIPDKIPRLALDEPGRYNLMEMWCLLIANRGCGQKTGCGHKAACGLGFAYALVLRPNRETGFCERVGIAQTFQSDWEGVPFDTIVLA
jgi:hypothetical protein